MRISYSRGALTQLDEIFSYIAHDNPRAASKLLERIESFTLLLGQLPQIGRTTGKPGVRVIGVPGYPYLIFYRILEERDEVRILRVRHTARRPLPGYR